jgi:biotin carboxyl carrier protein
MRRTTSAPTKMHLSAAICIVIASVACTKPDTRDDSDSKAAVQQPSALGSADNSDEAIAVDTAVARKVGIVAGPLSADQEPQTHQLVGMLIADPSRTVLIQAPVTGRLTADNGSGTKWPAFDEAVTAGTVVGQVSDARPLAVSMNGVVTRVFAQPGEIVQAGQPLLEVTDFSELLARIVWPPDIESAAPASITIVPLADVAGPHGPSRAVLVGPAADADSVTHTPVYLYRVPAPWSGTRPGVAIVATIMDSRRSAHGVLVPTSAVVQWQGLPWVYVERKPGSYTRERVDTRFRTPRGWLVPDSVASDLHAGDHIIVRGAELLLSEEFRSRVTVGEDEDKR